MADYIPSVDGNFDASCQASAVARLIQILIPSFGFPGATVLHIVGRGGRKMFTKRKRSPINLKGAIMSKRMNSLLDVCVGIPIILFTFWTIVVPTQAQQSTDEPTGIAPERISGMMIGRVGPPAIQRKITRLALGAICGNPGSPPIAACFFAASRFSLFRRLPSAAAPRPTPVLFRKVRRFNPV